jgi:hypothetical protein
MMLGGIAIAGIAALTVVITETIWVRRYPDIAQQSTRFAGLFSGPLGAYFVGYAALNAAVAFPLDTYWHTLYGIDVTLWAPFHIMIISGMALMAFGAMYILASAAQLAARLNERRAERIAQLGMIGAFAAALSLFTLLVAEASAPDRSVSLGFVSFSLFPVLTAFLLGSILVAAVYAIPRKWIATSVVGVSLLFVLIDQLGVPPALTWLMQIEQLTYRAGHANPPPVSLVAASWPLLSLVSAFLIDLCVQRARQRGWSKTRLFTSIAVAVLVGSVPLTIESPLSTQILASSLGIPGALLSLALAGLGAVIGIALGSRVGETTPTLERGREAIISTLWLQRLLLIVGVVGLGVVLVDLGISIAATFPGTTPARVDHVKAGPYPLTVSLYKNPANAGYALAFAVAPTQRVDGSLTYHVESLPGHGVDATPVRATFNTDPNVRNGIQGAAEITVKGPWTLQVVADGPSGHGVASIPITATALPPIPVWVGWTIGFVPFYALYLFFMIRLFGSSTASTPALENRQPRRHLAQD